MITFSMQWWELALIVIAVCVIFATVYLVKLLSSLTEVFKSSERLISENRKDIDQILSNVDGITENANQLTEKANVMTDEIKLTLRHVEEDVLNPGIATLSKVSKILGIAKKKL